MVHLTADFLGFGEVAEWFKAAVLKTPRSEHRNTSQNSQSRRNPSRNNRVPRLFAKNIRAQESAQMAWRYDEEKIERQRAERERRHIEEMDNAPEAEGWCYFFGGDAGIVKIGFSRNVNERINRLKSNCGPYRMGLLAKARGGRARERHYHRVFAQYSEGEEWFTRCPEIDAEIAALNERASS